MSRRALVLTPIRHGSAAWLVPQEPSTSFSSAAPLERFVARLAVQARRGALSAGDCGGGGGGVLARQRIGPAARIPGAAAQPRLPPLLPRAEFVGGIYSPGDRLRCWHLIPPPRRPARLRRRCPSRATPSQQSLRSPARWLRRRSRRLCSSCRRRSCRRGTIVHNAFARCRPREHPLCSRAPRSSRAAIHRLRRCRHALSPRPSLCPCLPPPSSLQGTPLSRQLGRFFSAIAVTKVDGASFDTLFAKLMEAGCGHDQGIRNSRNLSHTALSVLHNQVLVTRFGKMSTCFFGAIVPLTV